MGCKTGVQIGSATSKIRQQRLRHINSTGKSPKAVHPLTQKHSASVVGQISAIGSPRLTR
jgi:hypothetical protein